jgi:uncharacterized protein
VFGDPRVLVVTGGHPFQPEPFFAIFDAIAPGRWTHIEQPEAAQNLNAATNANVDAVVFYDMPGIRFTHADPPTEMPVPPAAFIDGLHSLLDAGKGLVFMHHAVAGWPTWPEYAEIVGGRFHYKPATMNGIEYPDSGYRFDVTHTVEVLDQAHPICDGLGKSFTLTDELYCFPVLTESVVPLLRTNFPVREPSHFYSANLAIRGKRNSNDGWTHPPGSDLVGWAKNARNSPVAYLQFGDGPETYANESFRKVLDNAIRWVASDSASAWARQRFANAGPTT